MYIKLWLGETHAGKAGNPQNISDTVMTLYRNKTIPNNKMLDLSIF